MTNNLYTTDNFETWEKCNKKYYYKYVKNLRFPEDQYSFELGKSVHALAYYYLKGIDIKNIENSLDEKTKEHWDAIKSHPILKNKLISTEWGFDTKILDSEYWINGRIDAIFYDETSQKYIIADWKTGQNIPKEPEKAFQSRIYMYAFFNAQKDLKLDLKQEDIQFQYIKTPDCEEIEPILYSKEKEEEYSEQFKRIINEINTAKKYAKTSESPSSPCKYCPYKTLCF